MIKEIHFYKDNAIGVGCIHSHNETVCRIKDGETYICTYAISALDFEELLNKGYDIYLHENGKYFQIKEGNVEATDKEIRKAHDIRRIWIAGGFDNFFYPLEECNEI